MADGDPALLAVLAELRDREPIFHRPELGTGPADLEAQTAPEFWEIGASGRTYSRAQVLQEVLRRSDAQEPDEWATRDFRCLELGPDTYLLTYTLAQAQRLSRRATIWRRTDVGWQIVYHQGTLVPHE